MKTYKVYVKEDWRPVDPGKHGTYTDAKSGKACSTEQCPKSFRIDPLNKILKFHVFLDLSLFSNGRKRFLEKQAALHARVFHG